MGLTIHYTLSVKRGTTVRWLKNLLRRTQRLARKLGCADAGEILETSESWLLEVWPGEGCETAVFGIEGHRRELPRKKGQAAWRRRYSKLRDWRLDAFCKTQYAGEHGWEHFRACHLRVIQLLDLWREAGARVEVRDEGHYWETRSESGLAKELAEYDRLIAGLGGMLKDANDEGDVVAPIFNYRNFERLEHEGQQLIRERRMAS